MSVELSLDGSANPVETKEQRRARKAAKKQAKLGIQPASGAGSSSRPSLVPSKSEIEVSQLLAVELVTSDTTPPKKKSKRDRADKANGSGSDTSAQASKEARGGHGETNELDEARKRRKAEKRALKGQKEATKSRSALPRDDGEGKMKAELETAAAGEYSGKKSKSKEDKKEEKAGKKKSEKMDTDAAPMVVLSVGEPEQGKDGHAADVAERKKKKEKKEKRKRAAESSNAPASSEPIGESSTAATSLTEAFKPAKKSKKDKKASVFEFTTETIFADSDLSEHGKKAIHYAYEHATLSKSVEGNGWKFSKGKQLWLMRHIWDESEVSEKYVDLVIGYLKTVQGLGRTGLIDTAKKQVASPILSHPVQDNSDQTADDVQGEQTRKVTFAEGEGTAQGAAESEPSETNREGGKDTELRRDRAKRMLAAIGAR